MTNSIIKQFNATNLTNSTISKTITYDDSISPNVTNLIITNFTFTMNGYVSWTVKSDTPLYCRWLYRTDVFEALPSFNHIFNCRTANCGLSRPNAYGTVASTDPTNLYPLANQTTYNLFYACYNDVPGAVKKSNVDKIYSWTTLGDKKNTNQTIPISSGYLRYAFSILILFLILFN